MEYKKKFSCEGYRIFFDKMIVDGCEINLYIGDVWVAIIDNKPIKLVRKYGGVTPSRTCLVFGYK